MGIDLDILEYCKKLKNEYKPPYHCPVENCVNTYRSVCGLKYHLRKNNHKDPVDLEALLKSTLTALSTTATATTTTETTTVTTTTITKDTPAKAATKDTPTKTTTKDTNKSTTKGPTKSTPKSKKGGRGGRTKLPPSKTANNNAIIETITPEPLTYEEAQKMVQIEINGQVVRWNINEPIEVKSKEEDLSDSEENDCKKEQIPAPEPLIQLPAARYKELDDYNICDAPQRPDSYIRFIEKSAEELDGEVEYDVDEEDTTWLALMNEKRETAGLAPVSVDSLELLMDRLEKESYFQASVNGHTGSVVDDDAVCCICMDGECQNTNVILFCDMCNLAVHQDCYGVPYIPEGQWLCRRCLQSPSRAVNCLLCPNQGGAFKQTDNSLWAHVVCALWIPEVRFANTVFLEPIDSIESIPQARWKLTCYICKQRNIGACIQCYKPNCYQAFHVTCAQQTGLYMKMDTVVKESNSTNGGGGGGAVGVESHNLDQQQPMLVQKIAFCDLHTPTNENGNSDVKKEEQKLKMKKARKLLLKKRTTSAPVILIPTIPPEKIQEIASLIQITKKSQFIQRLIAYWTLKRQYRNGVPLLRRLQSSQLLYNNYYNLLSNSDKNNQQFNKTSYSNPYKDVSTIELCKQLKYWQCLRQDLERARLLCELVRKREKIKLELIKLNEKCLNIKLKPLNQSLLKLLDQIQSKDIHEIFLEPVDLEAVPDYLTIVTQPMDLSTIRKKINQDLYPDLVTMEKDFDLMIANCLAYNNRDTVFYRAAIKMRDQCAILFRNARKELEMCGLLQSTPSTHNDDKLTSGDTDLNEDVSASDIDRDLKILQSNKLITGQELVIKLEELLAKSQALKNGLVRSKRVKIVRNELNKARKLIINSNLTEDSSQSDFDLINEQNSDNNKLISSGGQSLSPSIGVNRRTAVLITRKAQLIKKPSSLLMDDNTSDSSSNLLKFSSNTSLNNSGGNSTATSTNLSTSTTAITAVATNKKSGGVGNNSSGSNNSRNSGGVGGNNGSSSRREQELLEIKNQVPDSFKNYRAADGTQSNDENSDSCTSLSTCYSHELSEVETDDEDESEMEFEGKNQQTQKKKVEENQKEATSDEDEDDDDDDSNRRPSKKLRRDIDDDVTSEKLSKSDLKPLQLVWAKSRGYPWYPALIIDPKMPKGYLHKNLVPIPSPPNEVLNLLTNYNEESVYLILFFDAKRTWQWLPLDKLEILGLDQEKDEAKVNEPRKPADKKAVRKAYEHALQYQSQINGTTDK